MLFKKTISVLVKVPELNCSFNPASAAAITDRAWEAFPEFETLPSERLIGTVATVTDVGVLRAGGFAELLVDPAPAEAPLDCCCDP